MGSVQKLIDAKFTGTIRGSRADRNYASIVVQSPAGAKKNTSQRQSTPTHRLSDEETRLLLALRPAGRALALGLGRVRGGFGRGLGAWSTRGGRGGTGAVFPVVTGHPPYSTAHRRRCSRCSRLLPILPPAHQRLNRGERGDRRRCSGCSRPLPLLPTAHRRLSEEGRNRRRCSRCSRPLPTLHRTPAPLFPLCSRCSRPPHILPTAHRSLRREGRDRRHCS